MQDIRGYSCLEPEVACAVIGCQFMTVYTPHVYPWRATNFTCGEQNALRDKRQ